ncbi:MAG: hypothetical protein ACKOUR_19520, partial [Planctomycetota bacterium]
GTVLTTNLQATAATGITLNTDVSTLTASVTAVGDVMVNELNQITIQSLITANGAITVSAGGTITAQSVTTAAVSDGSNHIRLQTTAGDILLGSIQAGTDHVTIQSAEAIRDSLVGEGAGNANVIATELNLVATSGIGRIDDTDDLDVQLGSATTTGKLNAVNSGTFGDIAIVQLATGGNLLVTGLAQTKIEEQTGGIDLLVEGDELTLAGSGVQVTGSGSVSLRTGSVSGANAIRIQAPISSRSGSVEVKASGELTQAAAVNTTTGNISMTAVSGGITMAPGTVTSSLAGNVTYNASSTIQAATVRTAMNGAISIITKRADSDADANADVTLTESISTEQG